MSFDWFTVSAQVVNFLILVWLLKRFLYQPILHAIDERENRIASELADADATRTEAEKEREQFQHKNDEFDQQRAALLDKATDDANAERQRLLDQARQAAEALAAKQQDALKREQQLLDDEIARRTREEAFAIARQALTDLAATSLEERLGEVFTRRLRELDSKVKEDLGQALETASEPALVRSAFDLPAPQRATIQKALDETFSAEIQVQFQTAPEMISGVELVANGRKVAWSIADYLASLEKSVGELLKENDTAEAPTEPQPQSATQSSVPQEAP